MLSAVVDHVMEIDAGYLSTWAVISGEPANENAIQALNKKAREVTASRQGGGGEGVYIVPQLGSTTWASHCTALVQSCTPTSHETHERKAWEKKGPNDSKPCKSRIEKQAQTLPSQSILMSRKVTM